MMDPFKNAPTTEVMVWAIIASFIVYVILVGLSLLPCVAANARCTL